MRSSTLVRAAVVGTLVLLSGCGSKSGGAPDASVTDAGMTVLDSGEPIDAGSGALADLGESCQQDSDCGGGGLTCTLPTANDPVFGGGPAGGYCTRSCTSDADCGSSGACLMDATGANGTCLLTCTQGPSLMHINDPIDDPDKCWARPDVACTDLSQTESVCVPLCGEDSQCPSGMHCDPQASVCVATANTGLADGKSCTPDGGSECAGVCLSINEGSGSTTVSVCSQGCVLGVDPSADSPAGWTDCGGITNGLCIYSAQGEGAGDEGFCANACTKQDDCFNPDFFCFPIANLTGTTGVANGWCFSSTPCPNGASDCASLSGSACVQTAYGPECLSSQFPLGSAAPDAGTGG